MKNKLSIILFFLAPLHLFAQDSSIVFNPKRQIKLEGGSNYRDLGGYPTADGKTVKWGHIYRSADVSKLTENDFLTLKNLHLAIVCDLRGPDELKQKPDHLPDGISYINLPAGSENIKVNQGFATTNLDSMITAMYTCTDHLKAKYKPMFDQLLALPTDKSLMFHCTAGKDRTGMAAALVLSALGVEQKYVVADYAATDVFWKEVGKKYLQGMIQMGMNPEKAKNILSANPAFIETFFRAIDQQYFSMQNFLETEMELSPEKLQRLKIKYLN